MEEMGRMEGSTYISRGPLASTIVLTLFSLSSSPSFQLIIGLYCSFVFVYALYRYFWAPASTSRMGHTPILVATVFLLVTLSLAVPQAVPASSTTTSWRPLFTVPTDASNGKNLIANIDDPQAVDAQLVCPGYKASNVQNNAHGFTAALAIAGKSCNAYGTDIDSLSLTIEYQAQDRLHVEIKPTYIGTSNMTQYILPPNLVDRPGIEGEDASSSESDFEFDWGNDPSFWFTVTRKSNKDVLFSTKGNKLVFENQFIEFKTHLPADYNVYGLGEVIHELRLGNNLTRTIYAADVGDPIDLNIYGSHPFYLETRYFEVDGQSGKMTPCGNNASDPSKTYTSMSHGVYLRNAHGQEVLLRPEGITWRTIGGIIDLYFYSGPTQGEVTRRYQLSAAGLPAMQQYWTFGFHQCRWGYKNWSVVEDVVNNYEKFGIPLETMWTDIDYMQLYRDFTLDPVSFPAAAGQAFLQRLHAKGQHYVPIVDSAIYIPNPQNASDAYPTFTRGDELDVWMKNPDGSLYIGAVWPGYTVFPDWISPNGFKWWVDEMTTWHKELPYDGFWIDMSEVSSFCVGSCGSNNLTLNPVHPPFTLPGEGPISNIYTYPEGFNLTNATEAASASAAAASQSALASSLAGPVASTTASYYRSEVTPGVRDVNWPPYVINHVQQGHDLAVHAVSPNATHSDGTLEYDVHNLFGHQILNATYQGLLNVFPGKRPFIIGRSTFVGSGKWAGHWGGDNASLWAYMYFSISQALSFSLFGIPMFGVDTCGFNGNTDEELCNRWMQLSAFFTFYRNHNVLSANSQEAYVWASVAQATKDAMAIRFRLLPYMYTLMQKAHSTGSTVMRALAWEFPDDPSLADNDRQFMLGSAIMVTPVLAQGASTVNGVFPGVGQGTVWYDWYTQAAVQATDGQNVTISAPLGHIPVYVRGGNVLAMQEPAMTTSQTRKTPWGVLAALDSQGNAKGSLYVDDGESLKPDASLWVKFAASHGCLSATVSGNFKDTNALSNITVLGVPSAVTQVSLNGAALSSGWTYDSSIKALVIKGLTSATSAGAWSKNWQLDWS